MPESEQERSFPVSVYFTPKAYDTLQDLVAGSGYGSSSRTIEETVLAFFRIKFELEFLHATRNDIFHKQDVPEDLKLRLIGEMEEKALEAIHQAAGRVGSRKLEERSRLWKERGLVRRTSSSLGGSD